MAAGRSGRSPRKLQQRRTKSTSTPTGAATPEPPVDARYQAVVELCPAPIVVHIQEKIVYVNAAAVALFGAQQTSDLLGLLIWELIHPSAHDVVQQRIVDIRRSGSAPYLSEMQLYRRDGQLIDVEVAGAALTYAGQPAIQTVLRDLTKSKQMEKALRASEERYRLLFDNANDAIAAFTTEGIITEANHGTQVLLGWTPEELIGQHYHKVLTPTSQRIAEERTRHYLAGVDMSSIFEIEVLHKDGHVIPVEARTRPIRDQQGAVTGFQGTYRDITVRKRMETALLESRRLLERMADTLPDIVYLYDYVTQQIVYINRQVTAVLGYARNEIEGKTLEALRTLVHKEDRARFEAWDAQFTTASDNEAFDTEYRVKHVNGAYRWLRVHERVCTRTETDAPERILGIAEDVTARQRLHALARDRTIDLTQIPRRLREFRESLELTQAEFGQRFGGYDPRQIGTYERGEVEPPLKLLVKIHAQGYPLERVLGAGNTSILDDTLAYVADKHRHQVLTEHVLDTLRALCRHDRETMDRILANLGVSPKPFTARQRQVIANLTARDE